MQIYKYFFWRVTTSWTYSSNCFLLLLGGEEEEEEDDYRSDDEDDHDMSAVYNRGQNSGPLS